MWNNLRNYFLSGLIIFLPIAMTIFLFFSALNFFDRIIANFLEPIIFEKYGFYFEGFHRFLFHFLCIFIGVYLIVLIGVLARNFIGKKIYELFERTLVKLPFFRQVYPALKEMAIFVFSRERMVSFKQVVMVEYPRRGIYSIGFLTNDSPPEVTKLTNKELCNVFISTSPSPLTGFTIMVPKKEIVELDMSIEAAFKFVVSGGVVIPLPEE